MEEKEIMQPDAFLDLTKQIAEANGDQGKITALLTMVQDGYNTLFVSHTKTAENNNKLEDENKKLKEYNMELFMERGHLAKPESSDKQEKETEEKKRAETITFDDLFKEEK